VLTFDTASRGGKRANLPVTGKLACNTGFDKALPSNVMAKICAMQLLKSGATKRNKFMWEFL